MKKCYSGPQIVAKPRLARRVIPTPQSSMRDFAGFVCIASMPSCATVDIQRLSRDCHAKAVISTG
jgi:hypothetical protein